jgi:hypothetical protein
VVKGGQGWSRVVKGGQGWSSVVKGGQVWSRVKGTNNFAKLQLAIVAPFLPKKKHILLILFLNQLYRLVMFHRHIMLYYLKQGVQFVKKKNYKI